MPCSICDSLAIENEELNLCASCAAFKRKEERMSRRPSYQYSIPKRSPKRIKEDTQYTLLRRKQLQEHPECQVNLMGICTGKATTVHHTAKRGLNYLKKETFMSSCMACHDYVDHVMSAKERRERGLLKTL